MSATSRWRAIADAGVVGLGDELTLSAGTLRLRYAVLERDHTALIADWHVGGTPTGLSDSVFAIRLNSGGFVVEAEVALADNGRSIFEEQELTWWARDDHGQSYLGTWTGSGRQSMFGELNFFPTLDPKATRLDLMPSAPTIRAVIAVALT